MYMLFVVCLAIGTVIYMSAALMDGIFDWGVVGNINAISFDTTSGNTGKRIGACTLFQHCFGINVLYFECLLTFMRSCWRKHLTSQGDHQVAPIASFSNALKPFGRTLCIMLYAGRVITTHGQIYKMSSDPVGLLGAVRFVYRR